MVRKGSGWWKAAAVRGDVTSDLVIGSYENPASSLWNLGFRNSRICSVQS